MEAQPERVDLAAERREVEHLETHIAVENPVQQAPESTDHRGSVSGSAVPLPIFTAGQVEPGTEQALQVTHDESDLESFEIVSHLEHITQQDELTQQAPKSMSHWTSVLASLTQMPVLAARQAVAGLEKALLPEAEGSAQAAPEPAFPSGGTSDFHQDGRRPETPPTRSTSRASSPFLIVSIPSSPTNSEPISASPVDYEEQDPSFGTFHAGSKDLPLGVTLMKALRSGRKRYARRLVLAGAEVNYADERKKTPLMLAAWEGYLSLVQLLLQRGADVNAVSRDGLTPLHYTCVNDTTGRCVSTLLNAGADTEIKNASSRTPLHLAAFSNNEKAVYDLIAGGASKTSTDYIGRTPYYYTNSERLRNVLRHDFVTSLEH